MRDDNFLHILDSEIEAVSLDFEELEVFAFFFV